MPISDTHTNKTKQSESMTNSSWVSFSVTYTDLHAGDWFLVALDILDKEKHLLTVECSLHGTRWDKNSPLNTTKKTH